MGKCNIDVGVGGGKLGSESGSVEGEDTMRGGSKKRQLIKLTANGKRTCVSDGID